jgi:hypothetical protein
MKRIYWRFSVLKALGKTPVLSKTAQKYRVHGTEAHKRVYERLGAKSLNASLRAKNDFQAGCIYT